VGRFLVSWGVSGEVSELFLTVKEKNEFIEHATRATSIVTESDAAIINQRLPSIIDGEFYLPSTNKLLSQYGIFGSSNPNSTKFSHAEITTIPESKLSFLIISLENGKQIPIRIDSDDQSSDLYLVRDYHGDLVLNYKYFYSQGVCLLSTPTQKQLHLEYQDLLKLRQPEKIAQMFSLNSITSKSVRFFDFDLDITDHHGQSSDSVLENGTNAQLIGREVDNYIGRGLFYDLKTSAIASVAQLLSGHMFPQKDIQKYYVLMESIFDPVHGETLIIPRLPLKYQNKYQPRFSDPLNSLDVQYTNTIKPQLILDNVPNIVAVPAPEIINMMKNLSLDYETIGHLGTIMRQKGLLLYHRPEQYFQWSAAM
jgi:hypothetical protein